MKAYGLTEQQLEEIGNILDINVVYPHEDGKAIRFTLTPRSSYAKYARTQPSGRHSPYLCYHGFRDYILKAFEAGAVRVQTSQGDWHNVEDFKADLPRLAEVQVGSVIDSTSMIDLCKCGEGL